MEGKVMGGREGEGVGREFVRRQFVRGYRGG